MPGTRRSGKNRYLALLAKWAGIAALVVLTVVVLGVVVRSFLSKEQITKNKTIVRLPKGDNHITDGVTVVRTDGCNDYITAPPPVQVSMAAPLRPVEAVEAVDGPPRRLTTNVEPMVLPLPSEPPSGDSTLAVGDSPTKSPDYSYSPHPSGGFGGGGFGGGGYGGPSFSRYTSHSGSNGQTPIATPEPGTFFLVGAGGLAVISLVHRRRRKRA